MLYCVILCQQSNNWSLENLDLYLDLDTTSTAGTKTTGDVMVEGLLLEGAAWKDGSMTLSEDLRTVLPLCQLSWKPKASSSSEYLTLPLYRDQTRAYLIAQVLVRKPKTASEYIWAQRGVAFVVKSYVL